VVTRAATNNRYGRAAKLRIAFDMGVPLKGIKKAGYCYLTWINSIYSKLRV
jgi:hypothetical protein